MEDTQRQKDTTNAKEGIIIEKERFANPKQTAGSQKKKPSAKCHEE